MVDQAVVGGAMFDFISFPAFVIAFVLHMMMGMVRLMQDSIFRLNRSSYFQ